jgi:hypothetical protein
LTIKIEAICLLVKSKHKITIFRSYILLRRYTRIIVIYLDRIVIVVKVYITLFILFLTKVIVISINISLQLFIINCLYL